MSRTIPVSVVILTLNEAANIERCIRALSDFDEVLVVDSGSTDGTLDILRDRFPGVRVLHHTFRDFGDQRTWALDESNPRHNWVLFVDADEFMEAPLADEIAAFVARPGVAVGAFIAGRSYFMGRWLKHSTFFPSYQLRLLLRGRVRYRREGHGQREVLDGVAEYLGHSWRHEPFSHGIYQWIERHNRYSTAEVDLVLRLRGERIHWRELGSRDPMVRRRAMKVLAAKLPGRPVFRLLYMLVFRRGFLDGYPGWLFSWLHFAHETHVTVKLRERLVGWGNDSCGQRLGLRNEHMSSK